VNLLTAALGLLLTASAAAGGARPYPADRVDGVAEKSFSMRVVTVGLANPWEVTIGPDGYIWTTERSAGRVTRVRPTDGAKRTALTLPDVLATPGTQDGLLGMALHPRLLKGHRDQYVYLAHTYDADPDPAAVDRRAKIVRYTYHRAAQTLDSAADLITGLPASTDHNAGRLKFGPDGKLYYTIGDQGHNQFDYACRPILAQSLPTADQVRRRDWTAYQGKTLRLNLDGTVPADNPILGGVRSHVYTYGHRNAQGLDFAPAGRLYASEQGPKTDDEVNLIAAGGNYGWPRVAGFRDDQAYVYANWSASSGVPCTSLTYSDFVIPPSVPQQRETDFRGRAFVPPLRTFYTVPSTFNFQDPRCAENDWYFICWPTVAPSSIEVYAARRGVPGWADSLLVPTLKDGSVYRLSLGADGRRVGEPVPMWKTVNRYRDTAVSRDGTRVYVATDVAGLTRDRLGRPTTVLANPGAILEFHYRGHAG
jgi:PQQ-dependent dehydrogenase (s-GDH family)